MPLMYLFICGGEGRAFTLRSHDIFISMTRDNEIQTLLAEEIQIYIFFKKKWL